ncbi:protein OPAQUE10-like [Bidens hawaiensis]|uniref:protein OPAQUE10-like n=1 Tax=Bidens hawaiensis TaxID=980011 RepID=UPI00404A15FA
MAVDDSSSSPSFRELEDVFLQCQARIWIEEVLHTRFDDQLSIGDLLSDGELLFEVSKELWNMLLVKYMELKSYKSRMFVPVDTRKRSGRYRPYSNVDSFLKASFLKLIILFYFFLTCNLNFIFFN